jgi:hypothetical protein
MKDINLTEHQVGIFENLTSNQEELVATLTQLENRIRQNYVIQLVTQIVFTIGSQLLTSSHRVCP